MNRLPRAQVWSQTLSDMGGRLSHTPAVFCGAFITTVCPNRSAYGFSHPSCTNWPGLCSSKGRHPGAVTPCARHGAVPYGATAEVLEASLAELMRSSEEMMGRVDEQHRHERARVPGMAGGVTWRMLGGWCWG